MASSTRLAYVALFFLGQVTSWVLRDFAKPLLGKLPWIVRVYAGEPPDSWFGEQAVLRVALGNALFFAGLALLTAGVQTNVDKRYRCVHTLALVSPHGTRRVRRRLGQQRGVPTSDTRSSCRHVHKGHWALKTFAWALLTILPFLLPNSLVAAFGACCLPQ